MSIRKSSTGSIVEPRLLPELAAQAVDRRLGLLEEAAGQVPVAAPRLERAACEQHAAVALEDALDAGDRVGPVPLAARVAAQMIRLVCEAPTTAGTETPPYERTHGGT